MPSKSPTVGLNCARAIIIELGQHPSRSSDVELSEKRDLADARARVDAALAKLNTRYATAIRLRVLEEKSREEVAAALVFLAGVHADGITGAALPVDGGLSI